MTPEEAGLAFVTPAAYADEASFHEACALLRREDPIHLVETDLFAPFHVVTRHADATRSRSTTRSGTTRRGR